MVSMSLEVEETTSFRFLPYEDRARRWPTVKLGEKGRAFIRHHPCQHLGLGNSASRTVRNSCHLFKPPSI